MGNEIGNNIVNTFTTASVGANFTGAGHNDAGTAYISLGAGVQQKPGGLYFGATGFVENQSYTNQFTQKNFNTKPYAAIAGEVGYNRDENGFFTSFTGKQKIGIENNTNIMKNVGQVYDANIGTRIKSPDLPSVYELGACYRSETLSDKGVNRKFNEHFLGGFARTKLSNFVLSLAGGASDMGGQISPTLKFGVVYNFGK